MQLTGLNVQHAAPGIRAGQPLELERSLARVIEEGECSVNPSPLPDVLASLDAYRAESPRALNLLPSREISYSDPQGEEAKGLVFAFDRIEDLREFSDRLGARDRAGLFSALQAMSRDPNSQRMRRGRVRHQRYFQAIGFESLFGAGLGEEEGEHVICWRGHEPFQVFACPTLTSHRGRTLRRTELLVVIRHDFDRRHRHMRIRGDQRLTLLGEQTMSAQSLSGLPASKLAAFDREGREVLLLSGTDPLPAAHLEPRVLIEIPPPEELAPWLSEPTPAPRHRVLRRPGILADASLPTVRLSGREPWIHHHPRAAAQVLQRATSGGIYLHHDEPRAVELADLRGGEVLALCDLR
jgi:hypothetical protein